MSSLLKVIVGSKNPVKINAAKHIFTMYFPNNTIDCLGVNAPSNVPDQPIGEDETRIGAQNRVNYCKKHHQADYYVAMEGGAEQFSYGAATFAYVVIDNATEQVIGRSSNLPLPNILFKALLNGEELGDVMDKAFNTTNIKQKGGAIGLLTNNHATRESTYTQALTLAMAPFLHSDLYRK
ncbi:MULTISPECIES: inosine/xanthosine triphosphatase [Pseudoalteromonas]|jgi:inosine/xanthosine triphosphatase|uniref:inosine/xanthosine triphosphatase n=1 Tax=Pseudoalteromonas TaxID=53246 RepID=UPI00257E9F99|nr:MULTISPECIES: inosine/xanthosine triphosphatase [Pseudoalteromonas]MDP2484092.1 inosine/xanthosine triphosphatase [Pseudoalteromonas marina]|tara:strand:- start:49 stop:588 length:540 start_codon:yes stop_codon:yes gene_type:complete